MSAYKQQSAYSFKMSPRQKLWLSILLILALSVISGLIDWPKGPEPIIGGKKQEIKVHLGLDLQGGTHLEYRADTSKIPAADQANAVSGVRDVIERRVNPDGVKETIIQTSKVGNDWRVIVELPGVTNVNEAIKKIGETPLLEFKTYDPNAQTELTSAQQKKIADYNSVAQKKAQALLDGLLKNPAQFSEIAQQNSDDLGSKEKGGELGWFKKNVMVKEFEEAVFAPDLKNGQVIPQLVKSAFGYHLIKKNDERTQGAATFSIDGKSEQKTAGEKEINASHILVKTKSSADYLRPEDQWKYTGLTGKQLKNAYVEFDPNTSLPEVTLSFNDEGKDLFAKITEKNIGNRVGIFLDSQPISLPTVQEKIPNGQARITGSFTVQEAKDLAMRLNAGALPVPITLLSQQNVGPSLGRASVERSFLAGIIGLILVAFFMILYYRLPGLIAILALIIYALISLAIFKIIPVTLTLAGVAGFILSVGMAVDANVLIFERMKEELRAGKPLDLALQEGFRRAWLSIRDGNFSTLITCAILYFGGTSLVRGFGLTLAIGVIISMFSAIVVTRVFLKIVEHLPVRWLWGNAVDLNIDR